MTYYNVIEVESALKGLASKYASLTELIALPEKTYEGRSSHAIRIGSGSADSKDAVLLIGGVHAREWGSCEIGINFAADILEAYSKGTGLVYGGKSFSSAQIKAIVDELHLIVFPLVNPDGRHYSQTSEPGWRKNRNPVGSGCIGVDINRNFDILWDFPNLFAPTSDVFRTTSIDPCNFTYHGTEAFSEVESRNVRWLLDSYTRIRWFIDIHSYSQVVLFPWSDDQNQTADPAMNFMNPAFNADRGIKDDTGYKEYIEPGDLTVMSGLAMQVHGAIKAVRGKNYDPKQSFYLYPTSGTSDDYAYSRHLVDPTKNKVYGFTIEWGTQFQPPWEEMENIIRDVSAGLVQFCIVAPDDTKIINSDFQRDLYRDLAWAWLIVIGPFLITPGGKWCIRCGAQDPGYIGDILVDVLGYGSLILGVIGLVRLASRLTGSSLSPRN